MSWYSVVFDADDEVIRLAILVRSSSVPNNQSTELKQTPVTEGVVSTSPSIKRRQHYCSILTRDIHTHRQQCTTI